MRIIIVGGGISGLSLAYALLERNKEIDITVFEAEPEAGGKIRSEKVNGYLCEAGVNGFLDNKPSTLELSSKIQISPLKSSDSARKRFIYTDGALRMIPTSPLAFFMSNFLSLPGRLRMISELFIPKGTQEDETLESFATRRVGREFYEKLLDPMASGVYAGDPTKMSVRSCFGKVYDLEKAYGGLIKGFMALAKESKRSGKKVEAGPGGTLMSYYDGMFSLVDGLKKHLGDRLKVGKGIKSIDKKGDLFAVYSDDGVYYEADAVVLATPAHNTAEIVKEMDKEIASLLQEIPYPPIAVVAFGYLKSKIKMDTDLFGFLVPGKEKRKILGTLFDSSIFPNRAPEGSVLLRSMVGGARSPELALLDEEKLIKTVRAELSDIADIDAEPDFIWTYKWEKAIPQYLVGHHARLKKLDELTAKHGKLYLTGNAYRGVSVNDSIANSIELAQRIVAS